MSYIKKIIIAVALLGLVICGVIAYNITQVFSGSNTAFQNEKAFLYIPSGGNFKDVTTEISPLVKDVAAFESVAKRLQYDKKVQSGRFTLRRKMSNTQIIRTLLNTSDRITVKIPENTTKETLAKNIASQIEADEKALLTVFTDTVFLNKNNLTHTSLYLSGTYQMPWNTSAEEFRDIIFTQSQQ